MNNIFDDIAASTAEALGRFDLEISATEIRRLIQLPAKPGFGQFAVPLFGFAKKLRQPPPKIAARVAETIVCPENIHEIKAVGGFLNFWVFLLLQSRCHSFQKHQDKDLHIIHNRCKHFHQLLSLPFFPPLT